MMTKYHSNYLVGGSWSPVRPGVFFLSKMDGTVDVWDYLFKQNEPVLTLQVLQRINRLLYNGTPSKAGYRWQIEDNEQSGCFYCLVNTWVYIGVVWSFVCNRYRTLGLLALECKKLGGFLQ